MSSRESCTELSYIKESCLQASRTGNRTTDHSSEQSYNFQRRAQQCTAKKYSLKLLLGELWNSADLDLYPAFLKKFGSGPEFLGSKA
jgi:hypothetical protein